ncbi:hypothetical protein TELCIR_11738 [Teladorsagia circumcincta]|uniref:Uncharacterized protein n=1 Tax=Teladorsagia circumcincta TaxID=45464 RepID=A0A2G9U8E0_TELCI|nr:hypothetical protein TELCIR_11738 [Teladorsagia circumcincta]
MANVFNTFSFNKWADSKKEEEIDKESRRRRTEQVENGYVLARTTLESLNESYGFRPSGIEGGSGVGAGLLIKRLKERLRKERELRENGGNGDMDLEALIEALQSGEEINEPHVDEEPKIHHPTSYGAMDDEDILDEIHLYQQTYEDEVARQHHNATALQLQARFWMYNRRLSREDSTPPRPVEPDNVPKAAEPIRLMTPQRTEHSSYFRYNRIVTTNVPYE